LTLGALGSAVAFLVVDTPNTSRSSESCSGVAVRSAVRISSREIPTGTKGAKEEEAAEELAAKREEAAAEELAAKREEEAAAEELAAKREEVPTVTVSAAGLGVFLEVLVLDILET
jgi:hypothetical protein